MGAQRPSSSAWPHSAKRNGYSFMSEASTALRMRTPTVARHFHCHPSEGAAPAAEGIPLRRSATARSAVVGEARGKETRGEPVQGVRREYRSETEPVPDLRFETPQTFIHLATVEIFVLSVPSLPLEGMP